jgi:hypothetical protein
MVPNGVQMCAGWFQSVPAVHSFKSKMAMKRGPMAFVLCVQKNQVELSQLIWLFLGGPSMQQEERGSTNQTYSVAYEPREFKAHAPIGGLPLVHGGGSGTLLKQLQYVLVPVVC